MHTGQRSPGRRTRKPSTRRTSGHRTSDSRRINDGRTNKCNTSRHRPTLVAPPPVASRAAVLKHENAPHTTCGAFIVKAISAVLEPRGYEATRFLGFSRFCVLGGVEAVQQARVKAVAVRLTAVYLNAGTQRRNSHEQPHERAQNHGNVAHAGQEGHHP